MPFLRSGPPKDLREYTDRDPGRVTLFLRLLIAQDALAQERLAARRREQGRPPPELLPIGELLQQAFEKWVAGDAMGAAVNYNAVTVLEKRFMPADRYQEVLNETWSNASDPVRTNELLAWYSEEAAKERAQGRE